MITAVVPRLRGFRLPRKRAVQINAVMSYYRTATAIVFINCGRVPREQRNREKPCHDLPHQQLISAADSAGNLIVGLTAAA